VEELRGAVKIKALALLLAFVLLPAASLAAQAVKRFKFVVITHATARPFFAPLRKGAEDAGKIVDADVVCTGPAGFDIRKQLEFMKSAIAQRVDGIACTLPDPTAFNDVVKEAMFKGIPVIAINADAPASGRLAFIGQGNYEAGRSLGEHILKLLPNGCSVILGLHTAGVEDLEARIKGVKDVLDAKGGFKYRVVATGTDMTRAEGLLASALQSDPSVKGMFGMEDITSVAIGSIIERQKLKGRVFGGGFELVEQILKHIEDGVLQFTIDQQLYLQGFQGVMELWLAKTYSISPCDINTGIATVTSENVKAVKELAKKGYR
jgi:simple sugar transport system substrate-binding protein